MDLHFLPFALGSLMVPCNPTRDPRSPAPASGPSPSHRGSTCVPAWCRAAASACVSTSRRGVCIPPAGRRCHSSVRKRWWDDAAVSFMSSRFVFPHPNSRPGPAPAVQAHPSSRAAARSPRSGNCERAVSPQAPAGLRHYWNPRRGWLLMTRWPLAAILLLRGGRTSPRKRPVSGYGMAKVSSSLAVLR